MLLYSTGDVAIPQSSYFILLRGRLHQKWRLYLDDLGAFTASILPDDDAPQTKDGILSFKSFHATAFPGSFSTVAAPACLYAEKSDTHALASVRTTIKDNMHLNGGVVTTLGIRSYAELYGNHVERAMSMIRSKKALL